jgi:hypothetical protein
MANLNLIASARIVANGGEITSDRYKDAGATNDLKAGQLCYLSGLTVEPVVATGSGAAKLENDESPFDAAAEYVISLEDKTADGTSVAVQKINADTILEGYLVDADGDDVEIAFADVSSTPYEGYVDANGRFGVNNLTTKGVFVIVDVDTNYDPFKNGGDFEEDSGGVRHSRVQFRILGSKLL